MWKYEELGKRRQEIDKKTGAHRVAIHQSLSFITIIVGPSSNSNKSIKGMEEKKGQKKTNEL
jgi:hypothetical protein